MSGEPEYPVSRPSLGSLEMAYVFEAVSSGWISSLGSFVTRFEAEFAEFCGTDHAVSVSSGTAALHLALHALGIGRGDEVIVPDLSFIATANAVLMTGATPVCAEIEPHSLCLDPAALAPLITTKTRAIIPVHLYGQRADMVAINRIARDHGLVVIEDAAEAHGAAIGTRRVGGWGTCAAFSFYTNKCLTTGEGGMITTNDSALAARLRHLRDHAMSPDRRYWHDEPGFNYRMTNLQAAIGCGQMARAEQMKGARRRVVRSYRRYLGKRPGLTLNRSVAGTSPACWMVCLEVDGFAAPDRDRLADRLRARGVDTRPYFNPMSAMPFLPTADTPVAHAISGRGLNLPTYADLQDADIARICAIVTEEVARCTASAQHASVGHV
ncbi:MAG: aminotransferase class I/II-fold pyridoxal phosphate-dependent enzyme [Rhodobacteraceae bacterium]|nr:aminotransferase class I/II-fold pyridoxal phosphate-dependent enzyme [Paracoccaceae bacterium]